MLFDKKTTEEEIKLQLADLSVRLADVRKQVGELTEELDRLADRFRAAKGKSDEYERYAKKAIAAGSPDDAKIFLAEKLVNDKPSVPITIPPPQPPDSSIWSDARSTTM